MLIQILKGCNIDMVGNHLLMEMKLSNHVQKNSNVLYLKPAIIYFQMKRDDKLV